MQPSNSTPQQSRVESLTAERPQLGIFCRFWGLRFFEAIKHLKVYLNLHPDYDESQNNLNNHACTILTELCGRELYQPCLRLYLLSV